MTTNQFSECGVYASLHFSRFGCSYVDVESTQEFAEKHGSTNDAQGVIVKLFPPGAVKDGKGKVANYIGCGKDNALTRLLSQFGRWRGFFNLNVLNIGEENQRFLPKGRVESFTQWADQIPAALAVLRVDLIGEYEELVAKAAVARGDKFDREDYPETGTKFASEFACEAKIRPIPAIPASIVGLADARAEAVRQQMIDEQNAWKAFAKQSLWDKLLHPMQQLTEKLKEPDGKKFKRILETLKEVSAGAAGLNFDNDPVFGEVAAGLGEVLMGLDSDVLHADEQARLALAGYANNIIESFGGLGRRKLA